MSRIKIALPEKASFKTTLSVRIDDINYGGHLGNDRILTLCHEVRVQFFNSLEQSELSFLGSSLIMADSAVVYKAEAFQGEQLQVRIFVADISRVGFDLIYSFVRTSDEREIARAKTGMIFFDYEKKKIANCPEGLSSIFPSL